MQDRDMRELKKSFDNFERQMKELNKTLRYTTTILEYIAKNMPKDPKIKQDVKSPNDPDQLRKYLAENREAP